VPQRPEKPKSEEKKVSDTGAQEPTLRLRREGWGTLKLIRFGGVAEEKPDGPHRKLLGGAGAQKGQTEEARVARANREIHPAEPAGWSRVGVPGGVSRRG